MGAEPPGFSGPLIGPNVWPKFDLSNQANNQQSIILYIRKKRERERAGARQRRFVAGCRAGEGVRMFGCERGCRNFFLKLNAGCIVTKLKALSFFRALSSSELARDLKHKAL